MYPVVPFNSLEAIGPQPNLSMIAQVSSQDLFETMSTLSSFSGKEFHHTDLSTSFDILAAKENFDYRPAIEALQEIALQNSKPLDSEQAVYLFERGLNRYSLDQAYQALSLEGELLVIVAKSKLDRSDWCFSSEREHRLKTLSDLSIWWAREKSYSQL